MRLSCLPVSLYPDLTAGKLTLGDWFRKAKAFGLDGADVSIAHIPSTRVADIEALGREASHAGIQIVILAAYCDFTHPDARQRLSEVDALRTWIDRAQQMGASFVRVTAGQAHPGLDEASALGWAADGLSACLDHASAAGVRLLYENHVRGFVWQYNDFTQLSRRFVGVLRRIDRPELGVLFDTANNLALDEDPLALLGEILPRLGAVHISDLRCRGTFEPTTIGTGAAPIREILRRLIAAGYDGWLSIEEASKTGDGGFRRAVTFTDQAWIDAGGQPRDSGLP